MKEKILSLILNLLPGKKSKIKSPATTDEFNASQLGSAMAMES